MNEPAEMNEPVIVIVIVIAGEVRKPPPDDCGGWARLTERERAVARLAARALTNQQIARRLQITTHTVNFHLRRIFTKLDIDSRVSLARLVDTPSADIDGVRRISALRTARRDGASG